MSFVNLKVHLVFATKNRVPYLPQPIKKEVCKHIFSNCKKQGIFLQAIDGYTEHLHCLISMGKDQCISKIAQLIKGESSHWINHNNLINEKFMWQDYYYGVSASESHAQRVKIYIKNQEAHHAKKTYEEEEKWLVEKYGFKLIRD